MASKTDKKIIAGLLAIFLGAFGIHKFYLGYTTAGIIMLVITLLSIVLAGSVFGLLGLAATIVWIIGIIEGIIYLTTGKFKEWL